MKGEQQRDQLTNREPPHVPALSEGTGVYEPPGRFPGTEHRQHPLTAPEEGVGSLKARGLTPDDEVVGQRVGRGRGRRRFPFIVLSQWLSIPVDRVSPNAGIPPATPDTPGPRGGLPRPTVARKPWSLEPKPRGRSHTSRLIPRRSRSGSARSRTRPRRILDTKRTPSRRICSASRSAPPRDRSPSSLSHPLLPLDVPHRCKHDTFVSRHYSYIVETLSTPDVDP